MNIRIFAATLAGLLAVTVVFGTLGLAYVRLEQARPTPRPTQIAVAVPTTTPTALVLLGATWVDAVATATPTIPNTPTAFAPSTEVLTTSTPMLATSTLTVVSTPQTVRLAPSSTPGIIKTYWEEHADGWYLMQRMSDGTVVFVARQYNEQRADGQWYTVDAMADGTYRTILRNGLRLFPTATPHQ